MKTEYIDTKKQESLRQ